MQTVEKLVLKAAFQAPGGFDLYDLHLKFRLSPTILFQTCTDFEHRNMITREGMRVSLTNYGQQWVLTNRKKIFFTSTREWTQPSGGYFDEPRDPYMPYLPKLGQIDRDHFINLLRESD